MWDTFRESVLFAVTLHAKCLPTPAPKRGALFAGNGRSHGRCRRRRSTRGVGFAHSFSHAPNRVHGELASGTHANVNNNRYAATRTGRAARRSSWSATTVTITATPARYGARSRAPQPFRRFRIFFRSPPTAAFFFSVACSRRR